MGGQPALGRQRIAPTRFPVPLALPEQTCAFRQFNSDHAMSYQAPAHLTKATQTWFKSVLQDFALEAHHVKLLTQACQAWDRAEAARQAISQHGMTYQDRFDAPRARPEIAIERDSRLAFARLLRELCLDVEPPSEIRLPRRAGTA